MSTTEGMSNRSNRVNIVLDNEHAAKLSNLSARIHSALAARSLLSTALDQADPDPATATSLLDAIPGAFEQAQRGLGEVRLGRVVRLEDL